jgi:hypothetical protein
VATTLSFAPSADSYVNSSLPNNNYGGTTSLRLDASPTLNSYLRFDVQGVSGTVVKATLYVYANSSNSAGYGVQALQVPTATWDEMTITYSSAPPLASGVVGSSGSVASGTWTAVDVTAIVAGNGTLSLGLTSTSGTATNLASREDTTHPPRLEVQSQ